MVGRAFGVPDLSSRPLPPQGPTVSAGPLAPWGSMGTTQACVCRRGAARAQGEDPPEPRPGLQQAQWLLALGLGSLLPLRWAQTPPPVCAPSSGVREAVASPGAGLGLGREGPQAVSETSQPEPLRRPVSGGSFPLYWGLVSVPIQCNKCPDSAPPPAVHNPLKVGSWVIKSRPRGEPTQRHETHTARIRCPPSRDIGPTRGWATQKSVGPTECSQAARDSQLCLRHDSRVRNPKRDPA